MVEQNPIAGIHAIRFTIVDTNPVGIELGAAVRGTRVERRGFALGCLDDFAVQLGSGGLIESDVLLESTGTDGIKQAQRAQPIDVARVFCHLERDFDVGLGA